MFGFNRSPISHDHQILELIRAHSPISGRTGVDIPAGQGSLSRLLAAEGANSIALDIFPERIHKDVPVRLGANMNERLPLEAEIADFVTCQEGIEHIPNQVGFFKEVNRIMKMNGLLFITTPSISHLRARISNLLVESEYWRRLPASEVDSVSVAVHEDHTIHFGHLFLLPSSKLRVLLRINGFEIVNRGWTNVSGTSVALLPLFFPFLALASFMAYRSSRGRGSAGASEYARSAFLSLVRLNLSLRTLVCKDNVWVLRKVLPAQDPRNFAAEGSVSR